MIILLHVHGNVYYVSGHQYYYDIVMQVDPMIIDAGSLSSGSDTLINFTLVRYNTPQCRSGESLLYSTYIIIKHSHMHAGATLQSLTTTKFNAALSLVMLSFELFLLTLAVVLVSINFMP